MSERLNKLRFTLLPTTVYLSYLPIPNPSHNLSSNRFPKCIRDKGCFIFFFTRHWKKNNKKQLPSVEIGNNILIYVNIKRVFQIDIDYRPYIKYVGGRGGRVFVGAMKYFRHILMGHEIFFKIFDGPRNICACSIFIILFFKLKGLKHKISKPAIKVI